VLCLDYLAVVQSLAVSEGSNGSKSIRYCAGHLSCFMNYLLEDVQILLDFQLQVVDKVLLQLLVVFSEGMPKDCCFNSYFIESFNLEEVKKIKVDELFGWLETILMNYVGIAIAKQSKDSL